MTATTPADMKVRGYYADNTTTTEPVQGLAWDVHQERGIIWGVVAFGTERQISELKKTKLPTYQEVAARQQPGAGAGN